MRLLTLALVLAASICSAQTTQPLVQSSDLTYLGSFTFPSNDGTGRMGNEAQRYGGTGLSILPDGTLLYGCHANLDPPSMSRINVPALGAVGTVAAPCVAVPNVKAVDGNDGGAYRVGGSLTWDGRLIANAFAFYDADTDASSSHFAGPDVAGLVGPVTLAGVNPGSLAGGMTVVPSEWRALLGGPVLTGQCCISILSRTSYGPSAASFDPAQIGAVNPVPVSTLLHYPQANPLAPHDQNSPLFHGATRMAGMAFPSGFRSVLFFGRHGDNYCYGSGVDCNDPVSTAQGVHAYPYRRQVWAYDANDLAAVKAGTKQSWEVQPYATWTLTGIGDEAAGAAPLAGAYYDDTTRKLYVSVGGGVTPRVHVYAVAAAASQAPVDATYGPWSDWAPVGDWTPCNSSGQQSRQEQRLRSELTPAQYGGATQPTEETRDVTQACAFSATYTEWSAWAPLHTWAEGLVEFSARTLILPAVNGGTTGSTQRFRVTLERP